MAEVYTRLDWVISKTGTQELIGCVENQDGSMTEIRPVGTYQENPFTGKFTASVERGRLGIYGVNIYTRTSADTLEDLAQEALKMVIEDQDEFETCPECGGSGSFAKATWHSPSIPCDECGGTGDNPEVKS